MSKLAHVVFLNNLTSAETHAAVAFSKTWPVQCNFRYEN